MSALIRATAVTLLLVLNLLFWGTPVILLALVKLLTLSRWRGVVTLTLFLATRWVGINNRIFDALLPTRWNVEGTEGLRRDGRYLIISNHVSWVDVFALLRAFHGRTTFLRFFIKHGLIWFPIVGQAGYALDFPFMRRYSAEYVERHPEKRGADLETTRRACERYRGGPVAI
ncbi:MAG TPA: acetyltransferase, partial [Thermoanaerobaculia bacterium]|nr:acetyltransferase [Thermoanaerobaculia bacterium]